MNRLARIARRVVIGDDPLMDEVQGLIQDALRHEHGKKPQAYDKTITHFLDLFRQRPDIQDSILADLEHMAQGGDLGGDRADIYRGWKDEDFRSLLADLKEQAV